jgi:transcription elongation factor Elf1
MTEADGTTPEKTTPRSIYHLECPNCGHEESEEMPEGEEMGWLWVCDACEKGFRVNEETASFEIIDDDTSPDGDTDA